MFTPKPQGLGFREQIASLPHKADDRTSNLVLCRPDSHEGLGKYL